MSRAVGTGTGIRSAMNLGLIAGNGRFPFLVLDAARSMGHDVTVIATKEEAFTDLNDAAAKARAADSLDFARRAGQVHQPAERMPARAMP